jgi:hypothetical protein
MTAKKTPSTEISKAIRALIAERAVCPCLAAMILTKLAADIQRRVVNDGHHRFGQKRFPCEASPGGRPGRILRPSNMGETQPRGF